MEFVKMHGLGNDFIILDDTYHRQKNGREGFETASIFGFSSASLAHADTLTASGFSAS